MWAMICVSFWCSRVFPDKESMMAGALELAGEMAARSPVAVQGTKMNLIYSRDHSVAEGLQYMVGLSDIHCTVCVSLHVYTVRALWCNCYWFISSSWFSFSFFLSLSLPPLRPHGIWACCRHRMSWSPLRQPWKRRVPKKWLSQSSKAPRGLWERCTVCMPIRTLEGV